MSLTPLLEWMANTPLSVEIRESLWGYPIIETVHVLGLCLFLGFTVMLDLRLLGVSMKRTPASEVCGRLEPWMTGGFCLMIASGSLLFYGDPVKFYGSIFMRIKFAMLLLAGLNVLIFKKVTYRRVREWDCDAAPPRGARISAGLSLILWAGVVAAGRAIAYFLPPG